MQSVSPVYYQYFYRVQRVEPVKNNLPSCQPLSPTDLEKTKEQSSLDYSIYHSDIRRVSIYEPPNVQERAEWTKPEVPLSLNKESKINVSRMEYPNDYQNISFGYSHKLKTLYKNGFLPMVKKGFYGGNLSPAVVTLEHLRPHSQGGPTILSNLVLATAENNFKRGNLPFKQFYNPKVAEEYLQQFVGVRVGKFNGDKYVEMIRKTIEHLLSS